MGSVGRPLPGVQARIADDGGILINGPNIFNGYYRDAKATLETLVDGWLHTGDLGRVDEDGFLFITGRQKEIIITAGGKIITPTNLENALRHNRWISQAIVLGDGRPYLAALITLDAEEAPAFASQHNLKLDELPRSESMRTDYRQRSTRSTRTTRPWSRSNASRSCPTTSPGQPASYTRTGTMAARVWRQRRVCPSRACPARPPCRPARARIPERARRLR